LLKTLGELKKNADTSAEAMIKTFENIQVLNEMALVYQKQKDKRVTFDELKVGYATIVKDLEENANRRKSLFPEIESAMMEFSKEKSISSEAEARSAFFKSLDDACNAYNVCHANAQQGCHFHNQLAGYITKIIATVEGLVMARTMEKNDLVTMIGSQNYSALGPANPYIPRPGMVRPAPGPAPAPPMYQYAESQIYSGPQYGAPPARYPPPGAPIQPRPAYPPGNAPQYGYQQQYPQQPYPNYPPRPRYPPY